jgi:hypothetical protein
MDLQSLPSIVLAKLRGIGVSSYHRVLVCNAQIGYYPPSVMPGKDRSAKLGPMHDRSLL